MKHKKILRCTFLFILLAFSAFAQKKVQPKEPLKPEKLSDVVIDVKKEKNVADQVIADDLIVQGSTCVGLDCVNNESFSFDTQRLKENNLRIGFDDTSVGDFPANDWEITANESASGGSSMFAINDITGAKTPFRIDAGAKTNALYINSSGRIGLGTNVPVLDLHVQTTNTPAHRLEQTSGGGFTAQTWDIAGNEANFFVRDVTGGSRLPFRIRPGAPTSSIDIAASGNVGIGIASPLVKLHVVGDGYFTGKIYATDAILPGSSVPSDRTLKKDIINIQNASNLIRLLAPKTFLYDTEKYTNLDLPLGLQYGLIAQDVESIIPSFVKNYKHPSGKEFKTVNYTGLIPILIQGIKEQQELIAKQDEEIEKLKAKIKEIGDLATRLERIEAVLNSEKDSLKAEKEKK